MIASIDITGIKYNVSDKMQKYILDKIGKLDRYIPPHARKSLVADVKLRQVNREHGNKYEAEVILQVPQKTIIAKDSTMNMHAAVDIVEAKLIAQLRKYKDSITTQKTSTVS
jgi:putative sigma-54 modulation protein